MRTGLRKKATIRFNLIGSGPTETASASLAAAATRWILTVIIALGTMVLAVDRLFQWRLYRDACRRVKYA